MSAEFEALVGKNRRAIANIVRGYAFGREREDLEQEILTQLWRSFDSFRGDSKFETWLYRIAINTCVTFQRRVVRERQGSELLQGQANMEETRIGLSHDQLLQAFSHTLSEVERAIFIMYIEGLSSTEMESVLGIKASTIKVKVSRLKQKFKQQFVE